jgi:hypothetical protein
VLDTLTAALAVLMALASGLGLLSPSLYRDNLLVASGWRGNDVVTLAVAVPLLAVARRRARGGSLRAHLLWLGVADYALYNYLFYLFGSVFNAAFLVYVAIVVAATFGLALGLVEVAGSGLIHAVPERPARPVAAFLALLALGLGGAHIWMALAFVVAGSVPDIVRATGHPTNVVGALDLWLVVSWCGPAAWWLWHGQPWGTVLGSVVTGKGAIYMTALSAATLTAARAGADVDASQVVGWGALGVGCVVATWRLLAGMRETPLARAPAREG